MINPLEKQETYAFYNSISLDDFLKAAERAGLKNNPDMEKIAPYLKNAKKILDLGAGYGRCLEYLANTFEGEIHAVEFSHNLANFLIKKFSPRVHIYEQDMRNLNVGDGFDVVLSNWGAINNLNLNEQSQLLKTLKSITTKSGLIFFETKKKLQDTGCDTCGNGIRFTHANTNSSFIGYATSQEEFEKMANKNGYKLSVSEYDIILETGKLKKRVLYMLEKNS